MKTVKTLLVAILLTNIGAMAMTSKASNENKVIYEVLEGDTKHVHGKPGLEVDVKYKSEHVDVGVSADVNITISTKLNKGILKVNLRALKENTINVEQKDLEFTLTQGENSFPINLQLSSENNGIHYINLTMSVAGQGSRVVTVPFNVGTIPDKLNNEEIEKTGAGTSISVSRAEEEIK